MFDQNKKMIIIYVLALKDGKFYIGKTRNYLKRLNRHVEGKGPSWTRKYPPLTSPSIERFDGDIFDEDKTTIRYMAEFGIENVRGGSFCKMYLDESSISHIVTMIQTATDKCFICNSTSHFASRCPERMMF